MERCQRFTQVTREAQYLFGVQATRFQFHHDLNAQNRVAIMIQVITGLQRLTPSPVLGAFP